MINDDHAVFCTCGHDRHSHKWWRYTAGVQYPDWPQGGTMEIGPCWFNASEDDIKPCPCEAYDEVQS